MDHFLISIVILLLLIVVLGYFNEKVTKLTYEISLMVFSICVGGILLLVGILTVGRVEFIEMFKGVEIIKLDDYLMSNGILCFMVQDNCLV